MLGKLVPCGGGPPIPLLRPRLVVGRQRGCDIPLCFATISGRHCELELRDGYWFVRDLGSRNGTRVNGTPCESQRLMPNDVLWVASYRFTVVYTPAPGQAAPLEPPPPPVSAPRQAEGWSARLSPPDSPGGRPLGKLVPCGGGTPIPLFKPRLVLGRHDSCDIVLRSPAVSSRHCELTWTDGLWSVRDMGSRNGIRVNGVTCASDTLPPGSILWIAGLRYEVVYLPQATPELPLKQLLFGQGLLEKAGLTRLPPETPAEKGKPGEEDEPPRRRFTLDED
jgi:adenylate cyclase